MIITIEKAVELIKKGDVVAFPTETVYGLGADAYNLNAVQQTFRVKGRPSDNPLIVHISRMSQLRELASEIPAEVQMLADAFWPGPLTFVLKKQESVPDIVTGGLDTVAVRMPNHPVAKNLIDQTGPLTAPSANPSGRPSPTRTEHVEKDYSSQVPVLDGGHTEIGLESTVLDLTTKSLKILRPGAITAEMIQKVVNKKVVDADSTSTENHKSPGTRYTHYKPDAVVELITESPASVDGSIYYLLHSGSGLSAENVHDYSGDFSALARDLYDHFRTADHLGYPKIQIERFAATEAHPLLSALHNRISKAVTGN